MARPAANSTTPGTARNAWVSSILGALVRSGAPLALLLCAVSALAACTGEDVPGAHPSGTAVVAVDQAGDTVRLPRPAERVVAVLPSVNEFLLAMGAGDLIVARTDYDVQPELASLASIGGGLDPSLEVLLDLRPDLVVTWHGPAHDRLRERLRSVGIATFGVGTQDTAEVFRSVHALGVLTGRAREADSVRAAISAEFAEIAASVQGTRRPGVLYALSITPPMTTGPRTYVSELIGVAGGTNVFADLGNDFPSISLEEIVRREPDFILLPADSASVESRMAMLERTPGWSGLRAVRERNVIAISSLLLDRPGPYMGMVARMIHDGLHAK